MHLHALVLDGVLASDAEGVVRFHAAPMPPPPDLLPLLMTIARRTQQLLARRGISDGSDGVDLLDPFVDDVPTLAGLAAASVRGVAALGPRAGRPVRRWGDDRFAPRTEEAPRPWHARIRGFDLHAAVAVPAGACDRLERLCRYALRPAVAPAVVGDDPGVPDAAQACAHGGRVGRRPNRAWAELMERSFGFDVLACPRCPGRMTLVALIRDAAVVGRILRHLGLPDEVPVPSAGRAPPLSWEADVEPIWPGVG